MSRRMSSGRERSCVAGGEGICWSLGGDWSEVMERSSSSSTVMSDGDVDADVDVDAAGGGADEGMVVDGMEFSGCKRCSEAGGCVSSVTEETETALVLDGGGAD